MRSKQSKEDKKFFIITCRELRPDNKQGNSVGVYCVHVCVCRMEYGKCDFVPWVMPELELLQCLKGTELGWSICKLSIELPHANKNRF